MRVCTPHCGLDTETRLGGEMYELELLREMAARGTVFDILLARHQRHPEGVPNWAVHRLPIGRGLRWPVAALVLPPSIRRVYRATRFDLLRVHSLRFIGPAALAARAWGRMDVPIVALLIVLSVVTHLPFWILIFFVGCGLFARRAQAWR